MMCQISTPKPRSHAEQAGPEAVRGDATPTLGKRLQQRSQMTGSTRVFCSDSAAGRSSSH